MFRPLKDKVIHARLSEDEYLAFRAYCAEHSLTASEAFRRFAREAAGFGPTFDGDVREAIREYSRQLRAIGVNLNQIARILNSGRTPDYPTLKAGIGLLTKELIAQEQDYLSLCTIARKRATRIGATTRTPRNRTGLWTNHERPVSGLGDCSTPTDAAQCIDKC